MSTRRRTGSARRPRIPTTRSIIAMMRVALCGFAARSAEQDLLAGSDRSRLSLTRGMAGRMCDPRMQSAGAYVREHGTGLDQRRTAAGRVGVAERRDLGRAAQPSTSGERSSTTLPTYSYASFGENGCMKGPARTSR